MTHSVALNGGDAAILYALGDLLESAFGEVDVTVFDPDTVGPGPLRRVVDFPADGERLTADQPTGMTHTLVGGVPIRADGAMVPAGLAARPGEMLRG